MIDIRHDSVDNRHSNESQEYLAFLKQLRPSHECVYGAESLKHHDQ